MKGHEKNALNIYKTRMHLIGEDPSNMPHLFNPLATLVLPSQAQLQQQQQQQQPPQMFSHNGGILPQPPSGIHFHFTG